MQMPHTLKAQATDTDKRANPLDLLKLHDATGIADWDYVNCTQREPNEEPRSWRILLTTGKPFARSILPPAGRKSKRFCEYQKIQFLQLQGRVELT
jgi:hypothetical protein